MRSLLDGHIHLSRKLAARGHYPAIDILGSLSRLFPKLSARPQQRAAEGLRSMLAKLDEIDLLIQMGEYAPGRDMLADRAINDRDAINSYLRQANDDYTPLSHSVARLRAFGDNDGG